MHAVVYIVFGLPSSGRDRVYYTITSSQEVATALATTQTNPVVLMFWADWNIPCKVMMRPFRDMAWAKKKEAVFCRLDVDKCKDIVERFRVEALPTFLLMKQGEEKARVVGAKVEELNTIMDANIGGSSIPPARPVEELININIAGSSITPALPAEELNTSIRGSIMRRIWPASRRPRRRQNGTPGFATNHRDRRLMMDTRP